MWQEIYKKKDLIQKEIGNRKETRKTQNDLCHEKRHENDFSFLMMRCYPVMIIVLFSYEVSPAEFPAVSLSLDCLQTPLCSLYPFPSSYTFSTTTRFSDAID